LHTILHWFAGLTDTLAAWGPWGVFLLGFIDSAGIPVSVGMDALVILMGAKAPQSAWFGAGMAVLGSLGGNVALFLAARHGGSRFVRDVPTPGKPQRFRGWFNRYGLATVFIPALVPIPLPLKVFVVSAGVLGTRVRSFVLVVLAARAIRYFGEAWLGVMLGRESVGYLKDHAWHLVGFSVLLFLAIWAVLRLNDHYRQRA
jgi:membrane protein YqaA with SNARE-associated domain